MTDMTKYKNVSLQKETFRTQYDCLHFGYEESQKKLEEIGREEVNKYGMYIRFTCTPDPSI